MSVISKKRSSKIAIYSSISELPLYNWEKIVEGDVSYLIVEKKDRHKKVNPIRMMNAYDTISDQYFEAMDIDVSSDELFIITQKLIWKRQEYLDGDKSAMNFIRMYENQIKAIKQREGKSDFVKNRMAVTKWFGLRIDPKEFTLLEFVEIVKLMQEDSKPKEKVYGDSI